MKIPDLTDLILSSLPRPSNRSQTQAEVEIEWLFPRELNAIRYSDTGGHDWPEGIRVLKMKANSISAGIGSELQKGHPGMSLVLPGLLNCWRIWKILGVVGEE